MAYIRRYGGRRDQGDSLIRLRNIDLDEPEGQELWEDIQRTYPLPAREAHEQQEFDETLSWFRQYGHGSSLAHAREALDADTFDQFLRMTVHITVLDGFAQPSFINWRELVDVVSFSDMQEQEAIRFENPSDLIARNSPKAQVNFEELSELKMPTWNGRIYSRGFEINWETTTFGNLANLLQAKFADGRAANRTIEKFVFRDLLEDNPSIRVDDTSQSLFATSHTGGTSNDLAVNQLYSPKAFEDVVDLMSRQTIDGEPLDLEPRWIVVRKNSKNWFRVKEHLSPNANLRPGVADNTVNIAGEEFNLGVIATPVIDHDSVFVLADFGMAPGTGIELGFLNGQDAPEVIDIDQMDSPYFRVTRANRWLMRIAFGGTFRDFRGAYRLSDKDA